MSKTRTVLVTGGGSGIGRAITLQFAQNGDTVVILGRDQKKLDKIAAEHQGIETIMADITSVNDLEKAVGVFLKKYANLDVLVNCAGGNITVNPAADFTEANKTWKSVIELNLTGTFNVIFTFLPHITRPGGRIINITSLAAFTGSSQPAVNGQAYAAAKSGVHGLSRTLANNLAKEGITVNCVAPGVIDHTEFFGPTGMKQDRKQANIERTPEGRLGEPKDIAPAVFYLASEEASFVTGEILNVNGGVVFGR